MSFQIEALGAEQFAHLYTLDDAELAERNAVRRVVKAKPGAPCRVSLVDAEPGEEVLLVNYAHLAACSPFNASHAIYVRPGAAEARLAVNQVPEMLRLRPISLRGYDGTDMMIDADLATGGELETAMERMLSNAEVRYLHLHFAKPGCYAARVRRAE